MIKSKDMRPLQAQIWSQSRLAEQTKYDNFWAKYNITFLNVQNFTPLITDSYK
jgi:hypothetical protein